MSTYRSKNRINMKKAKRKTFPVKNGKTTLGMHLMLDAYGVPFEQLNDMKLVFKFLYRLPDIIGMSRLSTPLVVNAEETASGFDPGGISGVIMVNESHIGIHTFAKRGFFSLDVYSCSNFKHYVDSLLKYTKKTFPYKKKALRIVRRGLEYPIKNIRE